VLRRRRVEPEPELAARTGQDPILDPRHFLELTRERGRAQAVQAARLRGALLRQGWKAEQRRFFEVGVGLGIDHRSQVDERRQAGVVQPISGNGSVGTPPISSCMCRCEPIDRPVLPTSPISFPCCTESPTAVSTDDMCA
jgi:hypothetical protein